MPDAQTLWQAQGLLAKWFHFQPSEIEALDWQDFNRWCEEAVRQIKQRNAGNA